MVTLAICIIHARSYCIVLYEKSIVLQNMIYMMWPHLIDGQFFWPVVQMRGVLTTETDRWISHLMQVIYTDINVVFHCIVNSWRRQCRNHLSTILHSRNSDHAVMRHIPLTVYLIIIIVTTSINNRIHGKMELHIQKCGIFLWLIFAQPTQCAALMHFLVSRAITS